MAPPEPQPKPSRIAKQPSKSKEPVKNEKKSKEKVIEKTKPAKTEVAMKPS